MSDGQDRLHLPLISFAKLASRQLASSTVRVYLYALLPFLAFLDRTRPAAEQNGSWEMGPEGVRCAVAQYLEEELGCVIRRHRLGFELVTPTGRSPSNVGVFLAALKRFYSAMREIGCYADEHPLVDVTVRVRAEIADASVADDDRPPRMPDVSGVEAPSPRRRLTDSFFKLVGEEWVPQIIDDPSFPALVLAGGRTLRGWGLRDECVTRLLFETGGRISEVTGLTLGDWVRRGLTREVAAASKGSRGRRVKFLRFSTETATLPRRYVDRERRSHDPDGYTLADYLRRAEGKLIDLNAVPLFLTSRGTPLTAKGFRDTRWVPACRAAGVEADPHQARHWYVTMAVRAIYETSGTQSEVQRRLRELVEYMQWRGGQDTMAAYEHYFDAARHAEIQDQLHERLRVALAEGLKRPRRARRDQPAAPVLARAMDPDLAFLRVLGGAGA